MLAPKFFAVITLIGHTLAQSGFTTVILPASTGWPSTQARDPADSESTWNSTLLRSRDVRSSCGHPGAGMIGRRCWCYDDDKYHGPPTDRVYMSKAINQACKKWANLKWGDGPGLQKTDSDDYFYKIHDFLKGKWLIQTHLELVRGLDHKECAGPIEMDWDMCYTAMRRIVDTCDIDHTAYKKGGEATSDCLHWFITPKGYQPPP